jgi:hypothetical protein
MKYPRNLKESLSDHWQPSVRYDFKLLPGKILLLLQRYQILEKLSGQVTRTL